MKRDELISEVIYTARRAALMPAERWAQVSALLDRYERERDSGVAADAVWFLDQLIQTKILRGSYAREAMDIVTRWKEEEPKP